MKWSDDQIEQLKKLWDSDMSCSEIAAELGAGLSRNAVIGKVHRLGLTTRREVLFYGTAKPKRQRPSRPAFWRAPLIVSAEPPPPPSIEDADIPLTQRLSLLELQNHNCCWPVGEGRDVFFCGSPEADCLGGRPYCHGHMARARNQKQPAARPYITPRGKAA